MEENRSSLNCADLNTSKTESVTEHEKSAVTDELSVPTVETEKHHVAIGSDSAEPGSQHCEQNEQDCSSFRIPHSAVPEENEILNQHKNAGEKGDDRVLESQGDQDAVLGPIPQQELPVDIHQILLNQQLLDTSETGLIFSDTEKLQSDPSAFRGRESDLNEDMTATECSAEMEIQVRTMENSGEVGNHDDSLAIDGDISRELEHTGICALQTAGQQEVEPHIVESPDDRCRMEQKQTVSSESQADDMLSPNPHLNLSAEQRSFCNERSEAENRVLDSQIYDEQAAAEKVRAGTGYLDSVISSIQSLTSNQADSEKDVVKISRAELTVMVENTLAAHTMCNYMQDLVQENKTLNKQNEILKDTIVQTKKWDGRAEEGETSNSLPVVTADSGAKVFRFPGSLQGPGDGKSLIQTDGDMSTSLQLPSQLCLDGETSTTAEVSASGKTSYPDYAAYHAASGASVPDQGAVPHNIPNAVVFAEARCYTMGPQQIEESGTGSAGVSQERFESVVGELEKAKRLLNKIAREGGIPPNNMQELVNLRGKVQALQEENCTLKMELHNRPAPHGSGQEVHRLQSVIRNLEEKLQVQKKREDDLLKLITKVGTENKLLKSGGTRPLSQPSSSLGLQALPPIPPTVTVDCQTEEPYPDIEEYVEQIASMAEHMREKENLNIQLAMRNEQLKQAQKREEDFTIMAKNLHSELVAKNDENAYFRQSVDNLRQKAEALSQKIIALSIENEEQKRRLSHEAERIQDQERLSQEKERLKRKLSQEVDRCKQLEKIIEDERRRSARDEKELLNQVKKLTEINREVKQVLFAVDRARVEGTPLSQDCASQLAALRQDHRNSVASRTASSRGGVMGQPSASRFPQPQNALGLAHPAHAGTVPHRGSDQAGPRGHSNGRGSQAYQVPYGSLPPALPQQPAQQYQGQAGPQGYRNEPPQGSRPENNGLSRSSSGPAMNFSQHRQQ